jgi:hypothetical protein
MYLPLLFHLFLLVFCFISSFASGATLLEEEGMYLIYVSLLTIPDVNENLKEQIEQNRVIVKLNQRSELFSIINVKEYEKSVIFL